MFIGHPPAFIEYLENYIYDRTTIGPASRRSDGPRRDYAVRKDPTATIRNAADPDWLPCPAPHRVSCVPRWKDSASVAEVSTGGCRLVLRYGALGLADSDSASNEPMGRMGQLACESSEMRHMLRATRRPTKAVSKTAPSNIESQTCALARSLRASSLLASLLR